MREDRMRNFNLHQIMPKGENKQKGNIQKD